MARTIYVDCPFCDGLLEVDPSSGEVVQKWDAKDKPGAEGGDKMSSALKKLSDAKKKRTSLFDVKQSELNEQKKKLSGEFQKEVDKAKKEGVKENPFRPFDLD